MYDLIGDVHGYAKELRQLLEMMGYKSHRGLYKHAERKAIFLGDLINRGPDSKEVLQIVRPMVQSGHAEAVLGNHELNLMAFYTLNDQNKPLLSHSIRNILQLLPVMESFKNAEAELHDYIEWMYSLPLFIEHEDIRVVHACWQQDSIDFVRKNFHHKKVNRELMIKIFQQRGPESKSIHTIIKGPEIPLPKNRRTADAETVRRGYVRVKWWEDHKGKTYRQISSQSKVKLPNYKIPDNLINMDLSYPKDAEPVFIGHYSLNGKPFLLTQNICCLDFGVSKSGNITAYRWHGEHKLVSKNFVQIK
ncbi:MAG: metallophosphoesterase [Saprospiraceae bacterium]